MTELWVTLMAAGAWARVAGSVGLVGSFLAQRVRGRRVAEGAAQDRIGPSGADWPVTAEPRVAPTSNPAWVLVRTRRPAFADREMAYASSVTS